MTDIRWDPGQYGRFGGESSAPFFDLVARIKTKSPSQVVDLGCGPGNLTATLARRWPSAGVLGIDSSVAMIEKAWALPEKPENLDFQAESIADWEPTDEDDVVVANAALQWVPGHEELLAQWFADLRDGATFAMQVPGNLEAPAIAMLTELQHDERWAGRLQGVPRDVAIAEPDEYLSLAFDAGMKAEVWETTYLHVLQGPNAVLEWTRGTRLRPILSALDEGEAAEFEAEYAELLNDAYPPGPHGTIYPFRRIFMVATK